MDSTKVDVPLNKLDLDYWEKRWTDNKVGWQRERVNKFLDRYLSRLLPKAGSKVFVPLCGKTVDMRYLADKGHSVVGLEFSEKAVLEFFQEQKFQFTKSEAHGFTEFTAVGASIRILQGDFFLATKEAVGEVDAIWDRASLVAINPDEREKYAKTIVSLLSADSIYMIQGIDYKQTEHGGPPFSVDAGVVSHLYGGGFNIEFLSEEADAASAAKFKMSSFVDNAFLLTAK